MKYNNLQLHVFERDSYTCIFCNRPASEVHHVEKRSRGGRDIPQNLVSVCRWHHLMLHGERISGMDNYSAESLYLFAVAYVADYYAD